MVFKIPGAIHSRDYSSNFDRPRTGASFKNDADHGALTDFHHTQECIIA